MADVERLDCVVIGAGVVGLAVARALALAGRDVVVLEQHELIGSETSSRNSEVIHAGIYYPTGSVKAELCVAGKALLYDYCRSHGVPHKACGKVIVAADESQMPTIASYINQAKANGVHDLTLLTQAELHGLEPAVKAVGGALSPSTGIIDSHAYMLALQGDLESAGGMIAFCTRVEEMQLTGSTLNGGTQLVTSDLVLEPAWTINCAGLHAPDIAGRVPGTPRAWYAKGHYYSWVGKAPFSRLVYPVAEAGGLGVHVTIDMGGQVRFGPDVRWLDSVDYSFDESHFQDFLTAIERYFPQVDANRLHPGYTGIRPKISGPGEANADFRIDGPETHGVSGLVNLLGIESPGLTASLAIAARVEAIVGT